jgi:pimeloyl-ACP methyl ester carboxylesterase
MVVLVPGLGLVGLEFALLARRLRRCGYDARIFWHCPSRGSPQDRAASLQRWLSVREADVVHFVGHSFGGLLVLRLFAEYPERQPGRIVMLGVPVNGSAAARRVVRWPFGRWLLGRYVSRDGELAVQALPDGREIGGIAGTLNFLVGWLLGVGRPNDTLVSVEEALHAGMQDTRVLLVSHASTLLSRTVGRCVDSFLKTGRFPGSAVAQ